MAEEIMENVRLDEIVEFVGAPDPPGHREPPMGEMVEEDIVRDEPRHGDQLPSGRARQHGVRVFQARDPLFRAKAFEPGDVFGRGIVPQKRGLTPVQEPPARMLLFGVGLIGLRHGVVRAHVPIVAAQRMGRVGGEGIGGRGG